MSALAGIAFLGLGPTVFAYQLYGPWNYKATVPWYAPWYSGYHPTSGYDQANYTSFITRGYNGTAYGQIYDPGTGKRSYTETLYIGKWSLWNTYGVINKGDWVHLEITGATLDPTIQVNGSWDS